MTADLFCVLLEQDRFAWESNAPASFQMFNNFYFGRLNLVRYACDKDAKCDNLAHGMGRVLHTIYPNRERQSSCVLMLLYNLAEAEWVTVKCSEPLLYNVLCQSQEKSITQEMVFAHSHDTMCAKRQIYKDKFCHLFLWHSAKDAETLPLNKVCSQHNAKAPDLSLANTATYHFLFDAISTIFPPILQVTGPHSAFVLVRTYKKF